MQPQKKKRPLPEQTDNQKQEEQQIQRIHPSSDTSGRFALDFLIRRAGCRIWERKKKQDPIWITADGKKIAQSRIVKRLPKHMVEDARYMEDLYFKVRFQVPKEVMI